MGVLKWGLNKATSLATKPILKSERAKIAFMQNVSYCTAAAMYTDKYSTGIQMLMEKYIGLSEYESADIGHTVESDKLFESLPKLFEESSREVQEGIMVVCCNSIGMDALKVIPECISVSDVERRQPKGYVVHEDLDRETNAKYYWHCFIRNDVELKLNGETLERFLRNADYCEVTKYQYGKDAVWMDVLLNRIINIDYDELGLDKVNTPEEFYKEIPRMIKVVDLGVANTLKQLITKSIGYELLNDIKGWNYTSDTTWLTDSMPSSFEFDKELNEEYNCIYFWLKYIRIND